MQKERHVFEGRAVFVRFGARILAAISEDMPHHHGISTKPAHTRQTLNKGTCLEATADLRGAHAIRDCRVSFVCRFRPRYSHARGCDIMKLHIARLKRGSRGFTVLQDH